MDFKKLLTITLLCACCGLSWAEGTVVPLEARIQGVENPSPGLYFEGSFDFDLSEEVQEALRKGIALYFVIEVEVTKKRWYWFDREICDVKETIRLSFNPLTRSYRVSIGGMTQSFSNLEGAMRLIKFINNLYVGPFRRLNPEDYEARARFYLDSSKLPRPFQVSLKKDEAWDFNSGWFDVLIDQTEEK